jgi:hypothetical protein
MNSSLVKMTLFAKVLILIPFVIACLPEITESADPEVSRNGEIGSIASKVMTNSSNASTACHFHILESSLESVLKLMHNSKTNAIKLNVWIESFNDTMTLMNKTLLRTDMQWANEIGRALYSLILQNSYQSPISFLPNVTLTAGFRYVNIVVSEENERCLLSENNTLDHAIFDLLLRQLYRVSDDDTDYQLCITHNLTLNCCAIVGDKNIPICSYYSSNVENFFLTITIATAVFFLFLAFPLMLDYLSRSKKKSEHYYVISDSPMAISSIFRMIFIEGQGPVKSLGRKLLFITLVLVICLPVRNVDRTAFPIILIQYIMLGLWTFIFMIFDTYSFNDGNSFQQRHDFFLNGLLFFAKDIFRNSFEIIALPFNLKLWWRKVSKEWPCFKNYLKLDLNRGSTEMTERTGLLEKKVQQHGNGDGVEYSRQHHSETIGCFEIYMEIWKYRISIFVLILLYLGIAFPFSCVLALYSLSCYFWKFQKHDQQNVSKHRTALWWNSTFQLHVSILRFALWYICIFGLLMYSSINFFGCTFLFTFGLFLNGETYGNYFFPLSTILFYSWTNWKSSVETKYLVLITNIYEVCRESAPVQPTALANSGVERDESANDAETSNNNPIRAANRFFIKLNYDREPIIPKQLYNKVREEFLPYDRVLFYYFMGIFFVTVFAYFLYTMMSLSDRSGITSSVKIIGSMAATTLPIIFDFVWTKNSDEKKAAKTIALKSKLKRVLTIHSSNDHEEIEVEFKIKQPKKYISYENGRSVLSWRFS